MAEERSGSIAVPTWFIDDAIHDFDLSASDVTVFVVVVRHANVRRRAWPSQAVIIDKSGLGRSTVQRSLAKLVEFHLLTVVGEPSSGRGRATEYEIPRRKPKVVRAQTLELPTRRATVDDHTAAWAQAPLPPASTAPRSY